MAAIGESRQELLAWLNDLLQLNYTKVEQMGTGAALCQIFDSIYGDVPLQKVKFNTRQEYEYVNNYKVLQKIFLDHGIEKVIPVDRLVKCKMQDNLEFLQWVKRYWDTYYQGGQRYDAVARRAAKGADLVAGAPAVGTAPVKKTSVTKNIPLSKPPVRSTLANNTTATNAPPMRQPQKQSSSAEVQNLNKQVTQLQLTIDALEKERDFYFGKLRDVEIMVQSKADEVETDISKKETTEFCQQILDVLYKTEDGFEMPQEMTQEGDSDAVLVDETF